MSVLEEIIALTKRRGFVFPTSDIYGGIAGFYDLGPTGVLLAKHIKDLWWQEMVQLRDDVVGLDSSIILNPKTWEASGHVTAFTDPLVECKLCHERLRADQEDEIAGHVQKHKTAGETNIVWTEPRQFNLLFKTYVGPVEDSKSVAYLRGETCQGIYSNFANVMASTRVKIPFGIAQIGKAFRNEVTPGKFLFRLREFEQMELEYFVHPKDAEKTFAYWKEERMKWHISLGLSKDKLRFRQHEATERAHYAADSWDIEYDFPDWGFKELEGIANRTDYDLKTHGKWSGKDMSVVDPQTNESYIPFVIEPSVGVSRLMLALFIDGYIKEEKRTVLKLKPTLAPYRVAVFPLLANKPVLITKAQAVYHDMKKLYSATWDDRGNIGKRYLAQDEIGTPWCVTVDFTTLEDDTITIRNRDTTKQDRISISKLSEYIETNVSV
jgi:glycyl-tRNA synthetase